MRNGGLRIPSLMMSFGNGSSQRRTAFDIHKNNRFMGAKRPVLKFKILTEAQSQVIQQRLTDYKSIELKQTIITSLLTLAVIACILLWIF